MPHLCERRNARRGQEGLRPASSSALSKRKKLEQTHEYHPARLQNRAGSEQSADHRLPQACGGGALGVQLGLGAQAGSYRETGTSPSAIDLHRELNALKQTDVPWMYEVSKCAPARGAAQPGHRLRPLLPPVQAQATGQAAGASWGIPSSRRRSAGWAASASRARMVVFPDAIQLPRLGRLRLKERGYLPHDAKICSATVSEQAGHWYVSVLGGTGAGSVLSKHRPSRGGGSGRQDAGHALRWRGGFPIHAISIIA